MRNQECAILVNIYNVSNRVCRTRRAMWMVCSICALLLTGASTLRAAEVPASDLNARARQKQELVAYLLRMTPDSRGRYTRQVARIPALRARIAAREGAGQNTSCSHQI